MNSMIARATASAAIAAGGAALWVLWTGSRRRSRRAANSDLRTQVKTWEGEGGQLADPPAPIRNAAT